MKPFLLRVFLVLLLASGSPLAAGQSTDWSGQLARVAAQPDGDAKLTALMDLYWNWALDVHPELATWYGQPGDHGRWTDDSPEAVKARQDFHRALLREVQRIDRKKLSAGKQLDYDLLRDDLELTVAGYRFPAELMPVNQMGGVQQDAASLLAAMPRRNAADYGHILSRLETLDTVVDQTLAWLEQGLGKKITPPAITLRDVPGQVESLIRDDPFESPLLDAFQERPATIEEAAWEDLRARAADIYRRETAPAFRRLHAFLVEKYLPGARKEIGLSALPDGKAWYAHQVRYFTTTDLKPEEIHRLGLEEVKRIRAEMDRVIRSSGFTGTFGEFTDFLRTDPQFYHTKAEDLVREYRDIAKRADAELPKLFGVLPRNPYGVVPVPDYAARSQTTAYYQPGSLEAGRAGLYFVNTYALEMRPRWEMEALSLHESVPGHHLQISIAQELEGVHPLRRFGHYTAFVEGWALYAESLGEEMGFYSDPYSKFGQLTYEMWRAVRLVVDTGMHAKGWSREQAIDFFRSNSAKTEHDITVEIDRYIVWPGQALGYKLGELKIKELRKWATERMGERFDIRTFHDRILEAGPLPLHILDKRIRAWVDGDAS
jgi:uncharacterized protein (DUF885 family)